jgi:hypothetical protein
MFPVNSGMGHRSRTNERPVLPGAIFSVDADKRIGQGASLIMTRLSSTAQQNDTDGNNQDSANAVFVRLKIDVLIDQQMFHLPGPLQETEFELVKHGNCDPREIRRMVACKM